ncbi:MAG: sugar phosphate isomerase/epimerase [Rhizobiaceae bacterium]|nr:sugar phosphate isomerase/epimerase [Rhizobiaceae bacterium]MCV0407147.1 sugar phosphate isomerase/epimerase [Rhizobiaceae bacterium]
MNWSFQLYSARNFKPWSEVLGLLGRLGYTQVEGFGGVYDDPQAFRAEMDRNGLAMPSGHFSIDALEGDFDGVRRIADTFGMKLLICPFLPPDKRPSDAAGWKSFGERLAAVGDTAHEAGYRFAWHNHDFEFAPLPDGSTPQKHIVEAAPEMGLELDVAWVVRGGADPLQWIADYADRILAVHVKDIAPEGENRDEDGWADVGHGTVGWSTMLKELRLKTPAAVYAMEHDNPSDLERFARRSIEAVRDLDGAR